MNASPQREAGFDAVEFLFPYDYSTLQIQKQLEQNHLTLALFNTAPGDINAGEWGLSALPGREHEAHADIDPHWNMHWRSIVNKSM